MAITITYNRDKKTARVNGALGLSSVETVAVESSGGAALAAGTLCLHRQADDAEMDAWAVTNGECAADTRTAAFEAEFAASPASGQLDFVFRVKDADGNLLGSGCCAVTRSCAGGEDPDGFPASGGPLLLEAASAIAAGCPCMIASGLAAPCAAADHERFAGIALGAADAGGQVRVCRWGAAHIAGWGLTPGGRYWLPLSGQSLSDAPAGHALCAGYAQDADTLVLTGGRLAVQPRAAGEPGDFFLAWDADGRRLVERGAADTGGTASAGRLPRLDAAGMIPPTMIPGVPIVTIARQAISDAVRSVSAGDAPLQYRDVVALLYRLVAALKAAASAPPSGPGSAGDGEAPEFRGIIDDSQEAGDPVTTWSSAKILAYVLAHAALAVQVLPDVAAAENLPAPATLDRAAICHVTSLGAQYWCAGPLSEWVAAGYSGATPAQVAAAIADALAPVEEALDASETALAARYTKAEADALLALKADADGTAAALAARYTKDEAAALFGAAWSDAASSGLNAKAMAGTVVEARKRGPLLYLRVELHSYKSVTNTISANETLCSLAGVTPVASTGYMLRAGTFKKIQLGADGTLKALEDLERTGTSALSSIPWVLCQWFALA